jgi:hypothetical protein
VVPQGCGRESLGVCCTLLEQRYVDPGVVGGCVINGDMHLIMAITGKRRAHDSRP